MKMAAFLSEAEIRFISLNHAKRIILISDVHGNRSLLHRLLEKCQYTCEDTLIFLGDLMEKGVDSLGVLRDVMKLCLQANVYAVQGNCDRLSLALLEGELADFVDYNQFRHESLLNEMAARGGFTSITMENGEACRTYIQTQFKQELAFLKAMPLLLESEAAFFVHAGLSSENPCENTVKEVLTMPAFMEQSRTFQKHVYCGHWPVMNYHEDVCDCRVLSNPLHQITGIDGGNGVKKSGQLNALIIENGQAHSVWVDNLPIKIVQKAQKANEAPFFICWSKRFVEPLKEIGDYTLCRWLVNDRQVVLPTSYLYKEDKRWCCRDATNYFLPVEAGEVVSVIREEGDAVLAKKQGIVGWIGRDRFDD